MRICIVATSGKSLIDFRGKLISTLSEMGHEVICVSIEEPSTIEKQIADLGATYVQVEGDRVGIGLKNGFDMIQNYKSMFKKVKPDMCFLYMSKPIAFGSIAAYLAKVPHINLLVNGLENAYYRHTAKDALVRFVMSSTYRFAVKHSDNVFMQNGDDYRYFLKHHIATERNMSVVNGSGVDTERFSKKDLPESPVFLMVARLLWSKGIREYLAAASEVHEKCPNARFMLIGGIDHNDESLSEEELNHYVDSNCIEYYGYFEDVRPYLEQCSVFVLPSYHEGTPRSVLEAMSVGRAIITTDAPGCRETVTEGLNGYLVPVGDSGTLAEKMMLLAENAELRKSMGEQSAKICREKYDVNKVNRQMFEKMHLL